MNSCGPPAGPANAFPTKCCSRQSFFGPRVPIVAIEAIIGLPGICVDRVGIVAIDGKCANRERRLGIGYRSPGRGPFPGNLAFQTIRPESDASQGSRLVLLW